MTSRSRLTCIVPTAGRSAHLPDCVQALASSPETQVLLVAEEGVDTGPFGNVDDLQILPVPPGTGFARACNRGLHAAETDFVGLVNDDAVVSSTWCSELISVLREAPDIAAAQGTILQFDNETRVDGCGIAWNRYWQAIQIDRDGTPDFTAPPKEVFGVSGTAAVFRRSALEDVALPGGEYFEPLLGTYYEDVELACRIRSHGYRTIHSPATVARHFGGGSSTGAARWRWSQIYGNRLLVLSRLWGRSFIGRLPGLWLRDSADLARAALRIDIDRILGVVSGWGRATRYWSSFGHLGPAMLTPAELARFQITGRPGQYPS